MQLHVRLLQRLAAFFAIAGWTRADDIFPGMRTLAITRNDVIDGQMIRLDTAILACKIIAAKNGAASQR